MDIVLVHPEIAPNTGAIIRLCANVGARLHLIEPLGFDLDDRAYSRAGLDYHELTSVTVHPNLDDARRALPGRWWGFSAHGTVRYTDAPIADGDALVFGAERAGLTDAATALIGADSLVTIPMRPDSRSLNLANAVAAVAYDVWRRASFVGYAENAGATVAEAPLEPPFT